MRPKLTGVKPLDGFKLLLEYANSEKRILDTEYWLSKPMYESLKNKKMFDTVKIAGISITWANGLDIAPDDLYEYSELVEGKSA
ncbi:MAG: DUF2442 domain-containing protein [Rubrobacteridae bacterium]|nr:DUF2442 domain-containing protein [Rubrobacteridae bacterium]